MSAQAILRHLRMAGSATNRELQEVACDHSGGIARTMNRLIRVGLAQRIDGGSGRGSTAVYALKGKGLFGEN